MTSLPAMAGEGRKEEAKYRKVSSAKVSISGIFYSMVIDH